MGRKLILSISVLALIAGQAEAAVLQLDGAASVDRGSGFAPASNNTQLRPGDRVRVTDGCARVVYDNGYLSKLCQGQMIVVAYDPPAPQSYSGSLKDAAEPCCEPNYWGLAAVLAVAGGGIAAGISETSQSSNPPVTPVTPIIPIIPIITPVSP
jgi:hypothetical protein